VEVDDLVAALCAAEPRPTPVLGGGGIGKTTITVEALLHPRVKRRFGDRRYFVECDRAKTREELVAAIAAAIGIELGSVTDREARVLDHLGKSRAALVLDNAETPWESDQALVESLFEQLAAIDGLALVASIRGDVRPAGPRWREAIRVGPLGLAAARETFLRIAGTRYQADPRLDTLLEAMGRWPLAVVLMAHAVEGDPDLEIAWKRWRTEKTAMLRRRGDRLNDVELSLELSISGPRMQGHDEARRLLTLLGILPDGIARPDLDPILPGLGEKAAAWLARVGLASFDGIRVRVLAPVREYLQDHYRPTESDLSHVMDHFIALALSQGPMAGHEGGEEAIRRLASDLANVDAMIRRGLDLAMQQPSTQAAFETEPSASPRFRAIQAASALRNFIRFSGLGSSEIIERACDVAESRLDVHGQADCIRSLGDIALRRSDHETARARYEEALRLYVRVDDVLGQAHCIRGLGDIALTRSDHGTARGRYEEALLLYARVGNVLGQAHCIRSLGEIALARSDHEAARGRFEEALPLFVRVGDVHGQANCIEGLGDIALAHSDHEMARVRYEEALLLYVRVGSVQGQANCIRSLGDIALARSDHESAKEQFEDALKLYQRIPEPYSIGGTYWRLARIARDEATRRRHVQEARAAWASIGREDLIDKYLAEFGDGD
jgi:tetratricopeptide (TPR) repeat protein